MQDLIYVFAFEERERVEKPRSQFVFGGDRLGCVCGTFLRSVASQMPPAIDLPLQEGLTGGFTDELAVCHGEECPGSEGA